MKAFWNSLTNTQQSIILITLLVIVTLMAAFLTLSIMKYDIELFSWSPSNWIITETSTCVKNHQHRPILMTSS